VSTSTTEPAREPAPRGTQKVALVDADIHPYPASFEELRAHMPEPWRSQGWVDQVERTMHASIYVAPGPDLGMRADAVPPGGGLAGTDPDFASAELFERLGIDLGILIPLTVSGMADPAQESALFAATNSWLEETWLRKGNAHGRYYGSICVSSNRPDLAVAEIERWGGHERFVQVALLPQTRAPLGQAQYRPSNEAAARHDLPVAIHENRTPRAPLLTPTGYVSYYFEHHPQYSLLYAPHLVSFLTEGVFEALPSLRLVLVEGGFSWVAPVTWKLDRLWRAYGDDVPLMRRLPSETVREHVRFTAQPFEEPDDPRHLDAFLEWTHAEQLLLFSSDYPHWDFDDPTFVARRLPQEIRERVLATNAIELYGLPAEL
jgi:predicted TIM-barrel fold metal-dependent hydrolase